MPVLSLNSSAIIPNLIGTAIDGGRIRLNKLLGHGGWGVVYLGVTNDYHPKRFGVKVVLKATASEDNCKTLPYEVGLHDLCSSASPHVLKLVNVLQHEHKDLLFFITEYCDDGDLLDMIEKGRYIGEDELQRSVFLQILDAVEACHRLNVFHRDLKPENILCKDGGKKVALCDFGFATPLEESAHFKIGSAPFMSPEVFGGLRTPLISYSTRKADIWALGVILLNMVSGGLPWIKATIKDASFSEYLLNDRDYLLHCFPITPELNDLLKRVLTPDPDERISLPELREGIVRMKNITTLRPKGGVQQSPKDGILQVLDSLHKPPVSDSLSFDIPITRTSSAGTSIDDSVPAGKIIVRIPGQPDEIHPVPLARAGRPDQAHDAAPDFDGDADDSDSESDAESEGPITPEQHAVDALKAGVAAMHLEDVTALDDDEQMGVGVGTGAGIGIGIGAGAGKFQFRTDAKQPRIGLQTSVVDKQPPGLMAKGKYRRVLREVDPDIAELGQPSTRRMLRNAARMMGMAG